MSTETPSPPERGDFIREIVAADLREGRHDTVVTRFPPEPNGYLHIGHAKSICLNFGIPSEFGGRCHLRFDDTNPMKEEQEYIDSIEADVRWLGFDWGEHLYFASDYFEQLYEWAVDLVEAGKAYVDDLTADEIREHRGTFTEPGRESPWRDRPAGESLDLFARMRAGEFPDGARVLRAKIDMAAPNINLRDPVLYRILHAVHPRTGDAWCVYPTYDFAHGQSDAIEGITHSLCTLEFEGHRPLYDWLIDNLPVPSRPRQIEFARLNLTHTVLSKRVLLRLVDGGHVRGWDDPRMPTMSGIRRRGFPAAGIRDFVAMVGVAKADNVVEVGMLEHAARNVLNGTARRRFAVLDPLKVVIENYPEGQIEEVEVPNNPEDPSAGSREVPFAREFWIERDDFMEEPVRKFFRLAPGREVRLRSAYFVTCTEVVKDADGRVVELRCTYDPATRGGSAPDGRRPKATLHWVSVAHAVPAEVRLYDYLFASPHPGADGGELFDDLNPDSETVLRGCLAEPSLADVPIGETVQFERLGYFCPDPDSAPGALAFNRTLTLRDTWAKLQARGAGGKGYGAGGTVTAQVLGVSGSPMAGGATDRVVRRIMEAAELESELVRLWDLDVQPCKACLACAGSNICTGFDDDWLLLAVKLVRAEALVVGGWAPFNILDARTKTLVERAFSLRHSILLNAGTAGVAVVTGTVDPVPVADDVLAWFETEGMQPLGRVTPAGIDPCWSCGLGEGCVVGGTVPLVRGEYELFWYPYKDRLPAPEGFVITPELVPPSPEEQPHVVAEAERLGRELGEAVRGRQAERTAALERALPGHASLSPPARLRGLLAAVGEEAVGGDGTLGPLLERAERQAGRSQARPAVITLLAFGRRLLWERRVADAASRDLLAAETRRAIAELYEAAAVG